MPTPPIKIEVNAFIPQASVSAPLIGRFSGDNREIGEAGTHRTQHAISVVPNASGDPPYAVSITRHVGETHKLDANGKVVATATAPVSELDPGKWRVEKDGSIVIDLEGNGKNPLVPGPRALVPGITYDMQLRLKPNADGSWAVSATGSHDGFPGYEVLASVAGGPATVVHGYNPQHHGRSPDSLFPFASDIEVDAHRTVGPKGLVAAVDGAGYRAHDAPHGALLGQIAQGLDPLDMPLEDKFKVGPQLYGQAVGEGMSRIDAVAQTHGGTLTAMGANPANPEDVRRVTLDVAEAVAKDPERIVAEVSAQARQAQVPHAIEQEQVKARAV